jgi:homoserine O-acetyltransferase
LHEFPIFTVRDVVNSYIVLADFLQIKKIKILLGGSLGGQQALEWAIIKPNQIEILMITATNAAHSAWGIAFNESQRMAIAADQTWSDNNQNAGKSGMMVARSIGLLSYRNYQTYAKTQTHFVDETLPETWKAAAYQQYQGEKLALRFNAFSYTRLSQTMDSHHVGRGRNGIENALKTITANTLVIGIESDFLFPVEEQKLLASLIPNAKYQEIDSIYGHDGFLIEVDKIGALMELFLDKV